MNTFQRMAKLAQTNCNLLFLSHTILHSCAIYRYIGISFDSMYYFATFILYVGLAFPYIQ